MTKSACELSFKKGIHLSYSDNQNNFDDYKIIIIIDRCGFTSNLCDNL